MRLSPSFADQGRSGYQRGSADCSSFLGTGIWGSWLLPQPAAIGVAVRAMAAAAAAVLREGDFIGEIACRTLPRTASSVGGRQGGPDAALQFTVELGRTSFFGRSLPLARSFCRSIAARTKRVKRGCGAWGRLLNSGWNWQPTKYGCSRSSTISTS